MSVTVKVKRLSRVYFPGVRFIDMGGQTGMTALLLLLWVQGSGTKGHGRMGRWMDGWKDVWMEGRMDGWMDGRKDGEGREEGR
jgi:hypothetical protein